MVSVTLCTQGTVCLFVPHLVLLHFLHPLCVQNVSTEFFVHSPPFYTCVTHLTFLIPTPLGHSIFQLPIENTLRPQFIFQSHKLPICLARCTNTICEVHLNICLLQLQSTFHCAMCLTLRLQQTVTTIHPLCTLYVPTHSTEPIHST
jgi:hypothetical protein